MAGQVPPQFKKNVLARRMKTSKKSPASLKRASAEEGPGDAPAPTAIQRRLNRNRSGGGPTSNLSAPPGQGGGLAAMLTGGAPAGLAAVIGKKKRGQTAARGRSGGIFG